MNVLMVLTSHSDLGNTGLKTGFWIEEFAAPYYVLADAGVDIL
jgi:putative intracellular protease/amidase